MWRHPVRHFLAVAFLATMSTGCMFGMSSYSGGYVPRENVLLNPPDGPIPSPFVPSGLGELTTIRPVIRRVAIAELGAQGLPEGALKPIRGSKKARREVVVLPSKPFRRPSGDPASLVVADMLRQIIASAAATQPATQPDGTVTIRFEARSERGDWERIQAEYNADLDRQLHEQSMAEIRRLCEEAKAQRADVLIVITQYQHVGPVQSTAFSLLNLLVLPAFILPTEYFTGESSANGWLVDPTDGRVIATAQWHDRYKRLSQWMFTEGNVDRLWEDQCEDAVSEIAKKLLSP